MDNLALNISDDILKAELIGDMDHHGVSTVREKIDDAVYRYMPKTLEIELSSVEFIDSSGLGLILGRYAKTNELGIELVLSNPSARTKRLLIMTGIDKMIKIKEKEMKK